MKVEMIMPQMGESIAEATVLKWLKSVGQKVKKDETILEISTDKVDSEIPSPAEGILIEIIAKEGTTVPVKSVIAYIETEVRAAQVAPKASETKAAAPSVSQAPASVKTEAPTASPSSLTQPVSDLPKDAGDRFYTPLVRSMAAEHGLTPADLSTIKGTGENGRVTKSDLLLFLDSRASLPRASVSAPIHPQAHFQSSVSSARVDAPVTPSTPRPNYDPSGVRVEPMDRMRKLIAEHMVRSKATSPHVYSVAEIDVTNIAKCREYNQKEFQAREGFKLSFTPFFLEAAVKGLLQAPYLNSSVEGDNIILKKDINLGCAVALGTSGLIVPVIKQADQLSFAGIARKLNDLATRARDKKLQPDETQGGTFTVTNVGTFGNIIGYPIISQPQVAILALGAIKKRPMVVNDAIAIRDMVYLTLSYDHRIIDGSLSGTFLSFVTKYLESWDPKRGLL